MSSVAYYRQNIRDLLTESSSPIKVLLTISTVLFPVHFLIPDAFDYFAIRPSAILPPTFWIWTLVTYPFFEKTFLLLIIGLVCIVLASRLLEPLWGTIELAKFAVISWTTGGLLAAIVYLFVYMCTLSESYLYGKYFYGLGSLTGAVLVGLKQTRGEDFIFKSPMVSFQINIIPCVVLASTWAIAIILGGLSFEYCTLLSCGMYCAWFYLRFYQHHPRGQGDLADHFTLSSFFPRPINRIVKVFSLPCWQFAIRLGFCKRAVGGSTGGRHGAYTPVNLTLTGVDSFDAERRRQKALQQLNERLQKTEAMSTDLENDQEDKTTDTTPTTVQAGDSSEQVENPDIVVQ